jgi:hypothetical protein
MIKDAIIRISLWRCDEVPSLRSDSGKLDPISFGRIARDSEKAAQSHASTMNPGKRRSGTLPPTGLGSRID